MRRAVRLADAGRAQQVGRALYVGQRARLRAVREHRHHQPIAGARRRHVQQPALLREIVDALGVERGVPARRSEAEFRLAEPQMEPAAVAVRDDARAIGPLRLHVREHDDRELEPLRGVHGDHAHDIVGLLADRGVCLVRRARRVLLEPAHEAAQPAATRVREGARLVDELEQVRGNLLALRLEHRELDEPRAVEHGADDVGQRVIVAQGAQLAEHAERVRHRPARRRARTRSALKLAP